MRIWKTTAVLAALAVFGIATLAFAQRCPYCGASAPNYDPAAEKTIAGTVADVKTMTPAGRGMGMGGGGLHLTLDTASGPVDVHVGPASFVASKNMTFAKGDAVTVAGAVAGASGQTLVVAREIRKGDAVLTLRDDKGFPLWAGRGRR